MRLVQRFLTTSYIIAAFSFGGRVARAEATAFSLQATCGERGTSTSRGTGFVISSWHSDSYLLLTALHVVHGCKEVAVQVQSCTGVVTKDTRLILRGNPVHVWPQFDLAAIELSSADAKALSPFVPGSFDSDADGPVEPGTRLGLRAVSTFDLCPVGIAEYAGNHTAEDLVDQLVWSGEIPRQEKSRWLGDLSPLAPLATYYSNAHKGASGAPVALQESNTIVAMHLMGSVQTQHSWGLRFSGSTSLAELKNSAQPAKLETRGWPAYTRPRLGQSANSAIPEHEMVGAQRYTRAESIWTLAAGLDYPVFGRRLPSPELWAALSLLVEAYLSEGRDMSLGARLTVGARGGNYDETYEAPYGAERVLEEKQVRFTEPFAQGLLHLRILRTTQFRLGFESGFDIGLAFFETPDGPEGREGAEQVAIGLPFAIRSSLSPSADSYWSLVAQATGRLELLPTETRYRYSGIGGQIEREQAERALLLGLGLGIEY